MKRGRIRVLVVEDSVTVRDRLVEVLSGDAGIEIVGEAADGRRGIEMCLELRPDLITLDMVLPVMSGLAATEYIMAYCPTPILIVSSSVNRGELFRTYEALAAGAVDVLEKPRGDDGDAAWERRFLSAVKVASRIRVITHPRGRLVPARQPDRAAALEAAPGGDGGCRLVAIGASTGGPGAIATILSGLAPGFDLPILIVLHISQPFACGFAEWLNDVTPIPVALAADGEPLPARGEARVLVAPPDYHLVLEKGRLRLTLQAERHSCRPSADVLFESIAREAGPASIGCLLTGMGKDGARGLLAMRRAGAITLAQDESSCVVFGMPREAILLGAPWRVVPLSEIAATLSILARARSGARRPA